MHQIEASIDDYELNENKKVVFVVSLKDQCINEAKVVKLRYSEMKEIHDEIVKIVLKLKLSVNLPEFPKRKFFWSTSKSQEDILERKKDLTNYLNIVLGIEKLRELPIMKKYFLPERPSLQETQSQKEFNIQICIDRYTLVDDKVYYYVRLRNLMTKEEWTYRARYSELKSFHESLEESKIKNLPDFPKKKFFGATNESPEDIELRRDQLENYFSEVFRSKEALGSAPLQYFIEESKKLAQKEKEVEALRKKASQID